MEPTVQLLNEKGFDLLTDFLMLHHRVFSRTLPHWDQLCAWARDAENGGLIEIKAQDSLSGHAVTLTFSPEFFEGAL